MSRKKPVTLRSLGDRLDSTVDRLDGLDTKLSLLSMKMEMEDARELEERRRRRGQWMRAGKVFLFLLLLLVLLYPGYLTVVHTTMATDSTLLNLTLGLLLSVVYISVGCLLWMIIRDVYNYVRYGG